MTDRTPEALLAHRVFSEIEEIMRLRAEVERMKKGADWIIEINLDEIRRLLDEIKRLEKEADWLISTKIVEEWNGRFVGAPNKDNSGYAVYPTKAEAVASWRKSAREAVEDEYDAKTCL